MVKSLEQLEIKSSIVALRADLDVEITEGEIEDDTRLQTAVSTIEYLLEHDTHKIIVLGHMDRPKAQPSEKLSLKHLLPYFNSRLEPEMNFMPYEFLDKFSRGEFFDSRIKLILVENLRFWEGEKENSPDFARKISPMADVYVNEAFSVAHREHASVVALPTIINERGGKLAVGLHFQKEIEQLKQAREEPRRPLVVVMGGAKEDKIKYIDHFRKFADKILVGGRLPMFLPDDLEDEKVLVAKLNPDKCDITVNSADKFVQEISQAGTIILNGPLGKYEEEGQLLGTKTVFEAVASSSAYKVGGGGDTEHALETLRLKEKMDWVSVGGGASLNFLANGTLLGIEVLR